MLKQSLKHLKEKLWKQRNYCVSLITETVATSETCSKTGKKQIEYIFLVFIRY